MALPGQVLDAAAVVPRRHCGDAPPPRATCDGQRDSLVEARSPSRRDRRRRRAAPPPAAAKTSALARVAEQRTVRARARAAASWAARAVGRLRPLGREHIADARPSRSPTARGRRTRERRRASASRRSLLSRCRCRRESRRARRGREPRPRDRTDLLAVDDHVPAAFSAAAAGAAAAPRRCVSSAADHNDVAALLAADLEDLSPNLVVGNRVFGPARITNDLHQRLDSEIRTGTTARSHCRWPERTAHYIEVAAPCKHGGADFPGIP